MRLLVSVVNQHEAAAALAGGADVIDAKDPTSGPLGALSIPSLRDICTVIGDAYLVTAALGDADDEAAIEHLASAYAAAGARLVKVGFAGIANVERTVSLLAAAVRGAATGSGGHCGVVAVAYADADRVASLAHGALTEAAVGAGTAGVLLDTADKSGPGVRQLFSQGALSEWVKNAHEAGLLVAVAGRLGPDDLGFVRDAGADIAGVRGAACEGGRTGRVTTERVRALRMLCGSMATLVGSSAQRPGAQPRVSLHPSAAEC